MSARRTASTNPPLPAGPAVVHLRPTARRTAAGTTWNDPARHSGLTVDQLLDLGHDPTSQPSGPLDIHVTQDGALYGAGAAAAEDTKTLDTLALRAGSASASIAWLRSAWQWMFSRTGHGVGPHPSEGLR
ncbi:hypothetical protein ABTY61_37660 [Kitasatospora sp. NPDC096128]|uniref:hypothetical protein n=1 Tax=Kitasatospora sp. NPDC096128 TaxID=3155547 RepID=UPI0033184C1D